MEKKKAPDHKDVTKYKKPANGNQKPKTKNQKPKTRNQKLFKAPAQSKTSNNVYSPNPK